MKYVIDFTKLHTNSSYVFREYIRKCFPFCDREGVFSVNDSTQYFSEYNHSNLFEFLAQFQGTVVEIEYFENESEKYLKMCEEEEREVREFFKRISSTDEFKEGLKNLIEENL